MITCFSIGAESDYHVKLDIPLCAELLLLWAVPAALRAATENL